MFEPIRKISNLNKFKKQLFDGKIFVFEQSNISTELVQEIKKKIYQKHNGDLDKLHLLENCEEISANLVSHLKNSEIFLTLFKLILPRNCRRSPNLAPLGPLGATEDVPPLERSEPKDHDKTREDKRRKEKRREEKRRQRDDKKR